MKRRVFIAVNLSDGLKKRLKAYREKFDYLFTRHSFSDDGPVRWTKELSLHLTLVFIGYVSDEQMLEICRVTKETAIKFKPFFINFRRIVLGPPGKIPSFAKASVGKPRMIWLEGDISQELTELKKELEAALVDCDSGFYRVENRPFRPHITLARVKAGQWPARQRPELQPQAMAGGREANINKADIEQKLDAQVEAGSVDVMESDLRSDGAEYVILESCLFDQR